MSQESDRAAELDKRLSVHEAQCAERYAQMLNTLSDLKKGIDKITSKSWGVMMGLITGLFASCGGLLIYIFNTIPH